MGPKMLQHLSRPTQRRLGILHPVVLIELLLTLTPCRLAPLRIKCDLAAAMGLCQSCHELATKYLGQRLHREQKVWLARWSMPLTLRIQHPAGHHHVHLQMKLQILRPGVQHQTESASATTHTHPFGIGGKFCQRFGGAGKQGVNQPSRVDTIQRIQTVRQGILTFLGNSIPCCPASVSGSTSPEGAAPLLAAW